MGAPREVRRPPPEMAPLGTTTGPDARRGGDGASVVSWRRLEALHVPPRPSRLSLSNGCLSLGLPRGARAEGPSREGVMAPPDAARACQGDCSEGGWAVGLAEEVFDVSLVARGGVSDGDGVPSITGGGERSWVLEGKLVEDDDDGGLMWAWSRFGAGAAVEGVFCMLAAPLSKWSPSQACWPLARGATSCLRRCVMTDARTSDGDESSVVLMRANA